MTAEKSKINENNIIKNFQRLYRLSRIAGLNSYQMSTKRSDLIAINWSDVAYGVFLMVLFAFISIMNTIINVRFDLSRSLIVNIGFNAILIGGIFVTILFVVCDILNRKKIWKILCDCYDFDQQVKDYKIIRMVLITQKSIYRFPA